MKFQLYAIKDAKTGFMSVTTEQNKQAAIRNFYHACKNSESLLHTFPNDFSLFCLGDYETDTGVITPLACPCLLADASEVLRNG